MGPPQGKRAPRVGHVCIVILVREGLHGVALDAGTDRANSPLRLLNPPPRGSSTPHPDRATIKVEWSLHVRASARKGE
jgi:hypothetical protein